MVGEDFFYLFDGAPMTVDGCLVNIAVASSGDRHDFSVLPPAPSFKCRRIDLNTLVNKITRKDIGERCVD